ncbi:hypothetical protein GGI10_001084 [Coemansia sp. RSA 2530]|nr:hypothetical protein GGI10_001084 [Coemansia sp. RSA 2530]
MRGNTATVDHGPCFGAAPEKLADVEREIWELMQRGSFDKAVALSCQARKQQNEDEPPMSLLTQFALAKRRLGVTCLYAGVFASTHLVESNVLTLDGHLPLFAALLADRDPRLIELYSELSGPRRTAVDVALAGSLAYYYLKQGKRWRSRQLWEFLPLRAQAAIEWAVQNTQQLAQAIPADYARYIHAAWMLRRPSVDFVDVSSAGHIVEALLRAGITPDQPVLETLVTSSVRVGEVGAALPVYASRQWPRDLPHSTLVDLVGRRTTMALSAPRIHYDVLGASVRANDLHSVLVAASALRSRQAFHLAISIWVSCHKSDWKGVVELTRTMLRVLPGNLLHSTHHLVISAMVGMARPENCSATLANVILSNTLALHWVLAPRLESPSVAAIHKLLRALIDHGMSESAFQVYRDSERRSNWASPVSSDAIFAVLAGELARREDVRSIMHLASVATRGGVFLSAHFYSAVICGLTLPIKLMANGNAFRYSRKRDQGRFYQPALGPGGYASGVRRIQVAESLFDSMLRNKISAPVKVYHALMYAWALLGQPRQVQSYFGKLEQRSVSGTRTAVLPGVSEVTWGILLYSHARAHDIQGTLGVLARAREWVSRTNMRHVDGRTSYLVNISVCALLVDRDTRSALTLLDACIQRYNEYLQSDKEDAVRGELPATPADPVTRNLIIRALLSNQRPAQAMEVHSSMHEQFGLAEYASELKPMLKFCLGQGDASSALQIAERILKLGGVSALTDGQWIRLLRLCIEEGRSVNVAGLLGAVNLEHGGFRTVVMPVLKKKYPEAADWISRLIGTCSDDTDAAESVAGVKAQPSSEPPAHTQCLSLYRGLLRVIRDFPLAEMRKKLRHNARFCFELYRDLEPGDPKIQKLINDGQHQLQWLRAWRDDPDTWQKLIHKQ